MADAAGLRGPGVRGGLLYSLRFAHLRLGQFVSLLTDIARSDSCCLAFGSPCSPVYQGLAEARHADQSGASRGLYRVSPGRIRQQTDQRAPTGEGRGFPEQRDYPRACFGGPNGTETPLHSEFAGFPEGGKVQRDSRGGCSGAVVLFALFRKLLSERVCAVLSPDGQNASDNPHQPIGHARECDGLLRG